MKAYWIDECKHGKDNYIDSFTHDNQQIDLYVFNGLDDNEVCMRYGNNGADYYSPGTIDFMLYGEMPLYKRALTILAAHGYKPKRNLKRELTETASSLARCLCIINKIENGTEPHGLEKLRDILVESYTSLENITAEL